MKRLLLTAVVSAFSFASFGQLQGTVIDKTTLEPLPGATILLPELKQAVTTDEKGHFVFPKINKGKFLVQVRLLGYSGQTRIIDASLRQQGDFELEASIIEKNEVTITGSPFISDNRKMPLPVVPIDRLQLTEAATDNLIQSLAAVPGVSVISTGNGIAKPVIRGLGYNRVLVINQGVRQEGQQWGSEHGTEIDQFAADHVEILKGPASLEYGSDALGGVIHVLEPVPPPAGSLRGMLNSQFASNNRLYGNSLMLEGNRNGLIWQARAGMKSAAPYRTPKETVYNSGYQEDAQHALIGLNRQWGYTHLHASRWSSLIGLTEGERDPVSGKFIDADGNTYDEETLERRKPVAPRQRVEHLRITSTNSIIRNNTRLRLNAGFQENKRREYEESDTPGISMQLRTGTADARIYTTVNSNTEIAAGLSGVWRINRNLGSEYIIPDYHGLDGGVFITGKKENGRSTITGGIRFDVQRVTTTELIEGSDTLFPSVERDFSAFSGSVGIARAVSERTTLKLNAGKGFRAPSVPELTSNGLHEGTFRYEIGNAGLSPEHSWELDAGLMHDREKFSVHLDLFIGWLDNYIYYERSEGENRFVDGDSFPVYRYVQANAFRRGGELTFDLHPVEALHFENSLSLVFAENTSLDRPLPFTPPIRSVHEIRYDLERKQAAWARRMFIKLNLENVLKQDRIDEFETPTDGYLLLNAGAGLEGRLLSCDFHLFLNIRNITNTYYYDHLSRYKDIGVGGAGRNITLGLEVEFGN